MPAEFSYFVGRRFFSSGSRTRLASFISLLAIAGLVMGVALLIIVLSVMNGFDREMRNRILGVVPHMQIFRPGGITDWQPVAEKIATHPNVVEVTPFTRVRGMLNYRGKVQPVELQGLLPTAIDSGLAAVMSANGPGLLADGQLMLASGVAAKLGVEPGAQVTMIVPDVYGTGQRLVPKIRVFTVGEVFATHTTQDHSLALSSLVVAGELSGFGETVQGIRVVVEDIFDVRNTGFELMRALPQGYSFNDWFQTHGNLYQAIQMSRKLVGLLIFLIIAVAVFNVVAMLVMTVVEKRPAIAILKTQGAGNGGILRIFLVQGGLIGILGCGIGVVLGVLGSVYLPEVVNWFERTTGFHFLNAEIYPIDYVPSDLRLTDVLVVVAVALVLNFAATLYPAWKAAGVRPAETLRYE